MGQTFTRVICWVLAIPSRIFQVQYRPHFEKQGKKLENLEKQMMMLEQKLNEILAEKQQNPISAILQGQQVLQDQLKSLGSLSTDSSPQTPRPTQAVSLSRATEMAPAHQASQAQQKPTHLVTMAVTGLSIEKGSKKPFFGISLLGWRGSTPNKAIISVVFGVQMHGFHDWGLSNEPFHN